MVSEGVGAFIAVDVTGGAKVGTDTYTIKTKTKNDMKRKMYRFINCPHYLGQIESMVSSEDSPIVGKLITISFIVPSYCRGILIVCGWEVLWNDC